MLGWGILKSMKTHKFIKTKFFYYDRKKFYGSGPCPKMFAITGLEQKTIFLNRFFETNKADIKKQFKFIPFLTTDLTAFKLGRN
jgi:hypothetical protein